MTLAGSELGWHVKASGKACVHSPMHSVLQEKTLWKPSVVDTEYSATVYQIWNITVIDL